MTGDRDKVNQFLKHLLWTDIVAWIWLGSLIWVDWPGDDRWKWPLQLGPLVISTWPLWRHRRLLFSGTPRWAYGLIALPLVLVLGAVIVLVVSNMRWPLYAVLLLLMANLTILKVISEMQQAK